MYTRPTRPAEAGKYSLVPDRLDQPRARKPVQCTPWVPICISFKKPMPPIQIKLWVWPHQRKSKKDTGHGFCVFPFVGLAGSCRPIIGLKWAQSKMSQLSCSRAVKTWSECGLRLFLTSLKITAFRQRPVTLKVVLKAVCVPENCPEHKCTAEKINQWGRRTAETEIWFGLRNEL